MTRIVELAPMIFAGLKGHGSYWKMPESWTRLQKILTKEGLYHRRARFMSILFDHAAAHIPYDERYWAAAMTIPEGTEHESYERAGLDIISTPGGLYAVCIHVGPYDQIGEHWESWRKDEFTEGPCTLDGRRPSFEWYQNGSSDIQEELLVTFLCDPILST